jgi:hypothetical protein
MYDIYKFSVIDLWPHLMFFILFLYCYKKQDKKASLFIYIGLLIYCLLRYDVGWDYMQYVNEIINGYHTGDISDRYEYLSRQVMMIGVYTKFYPVVFIIFSLITLSLIYYIINKYSKNTLISWLVFYSIPLFFFESLSVIRQAIAFAFILYGYEYLKNKKYIYYLIVIGVATLFHQTAIIALIILPIYLYPLNKYLNIVIYIASIFLGEIIKYYLIGFVLETEIMSRYVYYINNEFQQPKSLLYLYYFIAVINLIFYDKLVRVDVENRRLLSIVNIGFVIYNIFAFEPVSAKRFSSMFVIYLILLIPSYIEIYGYRYKSIMYKGIAGVLLLISIVYISICISAYNDGVVEKIPFMPYKIWINYF